MESQIEKEFRITNKPFEDRPDAWVYGYVENVTREASLIVFDKFDTAIDMMKAVIDLLEDKFISKPDAWINVYTKALYDLSILYDTDGRNKDSLHYMSIIKDIHEKAFYESPKAWLDKYKSTLNGLSFLYGQTEDIPNGATVDLILSSLKDPAFIQILETINASDSNTDLNNIDISESKNLYGVFRFSEFNGDISQWILHEELNIINMFSGSVYAGTVAQWSGDNIHTFSFKSGIKQSSEKHTRLHANRTKHIEVNWKNGKRHGSRTIWDIKGNITFTATYHRGESTDQNGLDPQYDREDNLTHYIEYKDGHITNPNVPYQKY